MENQQYLLLATFQDRGIDDVTSWKEFCTLHELIGYVSAIYHIFRYEINPETSYVITNSHIYDSNNKVTLKEFLEKYTTVVKNKKE